MRRSQFPSPFEPDFFFKYDEDQPRDDNGRWASGGDEGVLAPERAGIPDPSRTGEVFVAGLRGYRGTRAQVRRERNKNHRVAKLRSDVAYVHGEFGIGVLEDKSLEHVTLKEKNEAMGAWVEKDASGASQHVAEPSFHAVMEGPEREIYRRSSMLGRRYDQQAVAVAVHDGTATSSGVYRLSFGGTLRDSDMEAVTQHFVDAGLGGATALLDKNELRLLATKKSEMNLITRSLNSLPRTYGARLDFTPARVKFISQDEYARFTKATHGSANVTAEVFIGGIRQPK